MAGRRNTSVKLSPRYGRTGPNTYELVVKMNQAMARELLKVLHQQLDEGKISSRGMGLARSLNKCLRYLELRREVLP